ncbi:cystinosin [Artemisia annua]|uniref:Cystinosin n=1 Tax=Artemisia annua TaxID=35608 RepID=A0A2U1NLV3_ARTAN|nr:cystinosin [Artemisia annua]
MNFKRKCTIGFSIGNILLDLLRGVANYGQMAVQSIDQGICSFYENSDSKLWWYNRRPNIWFILLVLVRFMGELLWEYRKNIAFFVVKLL